MNSGDTRGNAGIENLNQWGDPTISHIIVHKPNDARILADTADDNRLIYNEALRKGIECEDETTSLLIFYPLHKSYFSSAARVAIARLGKVQEQERLDYQNQNMPEYGAVVSRDSCLGLWERLNSFEKNDCRKIDAFGIKRNYNRSFTVGIGKWSSQAETEGFTYRDALRKFGKSGTVESSIHSGENEGLLVMNPGFKHLLLPQAYLETAHSLPLVERKMIDKQMHEEELSSKFGLKRRAYDPEAVIRTWAGNRPFNGKAPLYPRGSSGGGPAQMKLRGAPPPASGSRSAAEWEGSRPPQSEAPSRGSTSPRSAPNSENSAETVVSPGANRAQSAAGSMAAKDPPNYARPTQASLAKRAPPRRRDGR